MISCIMQEPVYGINLGAIRDDLYCDSIKRFLLTVLPLRLPINEWLYTVETTAQIL